MIKKKRWGKKSRWGNERRYRKTEVKGKGLTLANVDRNGRTREGEVNGKKPSAGGRLVAN